MTPTRKRVLNMFLEKESMLGTLYTFQGQGKSLLRSLVRCGVGWNVSKLRATKGRRASNERESSVSPGPCPGLQGSPRVLVLLGLLFLIPQLHSETIIFFPAGNWCIRTMTAGFRRGKKIQGTESPAGLNHFGTQNKTPRSGICKT